MRTGFWLWIVLLGFSMTACVGGVVEAVEGSLKGRRLESFPHVDPFWFAWAAFHPETEVYGFPTSP